MAVSDTLDDLRTQFPDCQMIAFLDLSADMVLVTSAKENIAQERWDRLCAMAHDVLRGPSTAHALTCLGAKPPATLGRAALINAAKCDVFLSNKTAPDFVLCAVGCAELPLSAFYAAAQPVLDQLVQDD